jgi:Zn finger protein HypA/HybF involved in hydrogenase expression
MTLLGEQAMKEGISKGGQNFWCETCQDTGFVGLLFKKRCPGCGGNPLNIVRRRPPPPSGSEEKSRKN